MEMNNMDFFKKCHRPLYYKAKLNKMRNGDTLLLGSIAAEYPINDDTDDVLESFGQAYIVKETKGIFRFTGLWTLLTKPSRPHIWCEGTFKIDKGTIKFEDDLNDVCLSNFFLISRYISRIKKLTHKNHYRLEDDDMSWFDDLFYINGLPYLYDGLVIDKNGLTIDTCILRYKRGEKELIPYRRGRIGRVVFGEGELNKICTPPMQAIVNVGFATGCIDFK